MPAKQHHLVIGLEYFIMTTLQNLIGKNYPLKLVRMR